MVCYCVPLGHTLVKSLIITRVFVTGLIWENSDSHWFSTLDMLDRTPNFLITYFLLSNFHENKQALPYDSSSTNMQGGIEGKERGPINLSKVHFAFYKLYYYNLLGNMWIMLETYVNVELTNRLIKRTLLVIG